MYKKTDYSHCPNGSRHEWQFAGGVTIERKTGREISNRKCQNCGLVKKVFEATGQRVNR
jgi:hypothetical protein